MLCSIHLLKNKTSKCIIACFVFFLTYLNCNAQSFNHQTVLDNLQFVDTSQSYNNFEKLKYFYNIKGKLDKTNFPFDSVYATALFRIAIYEVRVNKNYTIAINYINSALKVNPNLSSKLNVTKCYFKLAQYYQILGITDKANSYYDSTIIVAKRFPDTTNYISYSKIDRAYIFFLKGDYQKAIEESIDGMNYSLQKKDSSYFLAFANQKAQSLCLENNLPKALFEINIIIDAAKRQNELFELASALKTKGIVFQKKQKFILADSLFRNAIRVRTQTKDFQQTANDYIDYGNFTWIVCMTIKMQKSAICKVFYMDKNLQIQL